MARRLNTLATLVVLALALGASVDAQGPSDTGNGPPGTPTTPPPGTPTITTVAPVVTTPPPGTVPTTPPPGGQPLPTPTTKRPVGGVPVPDTGSSDADNGTVPKTTTPAPSRTTRPPAAAAAVPGVTPATPAPPITPTPPEILIDRQVKSEYGTRAPTGNETASTSTDKSEASKMGSWLVPAVIGAVIISALIIMTFFVRSHRGGGNADEEYTTPHGRRGSDNFHELPKSTTHHVNVPVLGDPVKDKVAADQNMRAIAMAGGPAHHSPRANRVASSPPLMAEPNRPPSPGFGTNKQNKHMEGSSVGF